MKNTLAPLGDFAQYRLLFVVILLGFCGNSATKNRKVNMWIQSIMSELERERGMRIYVFPRLKSQGKLTESEAAERLERLSGAIQLCRTLIDHGVVQTGELQLRLTPPANLTTGKDKVRTLPIIKGAE